MSTSVEGQSKNIEVKLKAGNGNRVLGKIQHLFPLALIVVVTGCSTLQPASYPQQPYPTKYPTDPGSTSPSADIPQMPEQKPPVKNEPDIVPGDTQVAMGTANAVHGLIDDAWDHYNGGEYDRAVAVAERAMRLNRRNPEIYLVMASAHYQRYRNDLARQLVRQGLSFSERGTRVHARLETLLRQLGG